jgi:hypothetical protein
VIANEYDADNPYTPYLRMLTAEALVGLVNSAWVELDAMMQEDRDYRDLRCWEVKEFLFWADMKDLTEYVDGQEKIEGNARDFLDRYLATHPTHWAGRSINLIWLAAELVRDYKMDEDNE